MEEEFYKYVDVIEAAKELGLPKELMKHVHAFWTLKRKVCTDAVCLFLILRNNTIQKTVSTSAQFEEKKQNRFTLDFCW